MYTYNFNLFVISTACRKRMTAHECLLHPWLVGDHSDKTSVINSSRYLNIRDRIRAKYELWNSYPIALGRLSEYSALRKLLIDKYCIRDTSFGKPLFILQVLTNKIIF